MPSLYEGNKILPSDILNGKVQIGNVYYVRQTSETGYSDFFDKYNYVNNAGQNSVQPTITAALAVAGDYDTIYVTPGTYEEEGMTITQAGLKLIGLAVTGLTRNTPMILGETKALLNINADDVEVAGFHFYQVGAFAAVIVATTAFGDAVWRTYIHDCHWDGDAMTYGIILGQTGGAGAAEAVAAVVERCKFLYVVTACIQNNSENVVIQNCLFRCIASCIGIEDTPDGDDRPDRWYLDNRFQTVDGTNAIGIKVTNTPTAGLIFIDGNHFGFKFNDTAHCISKTNAGYLGLNYRGHGAITAT